MVRKENGMIRVCHVAVADLWAGAEVQLKVLLSKLRRRRDLSLAVILFNEGRLEKEINGLGIPVKVFPEHLWGPPRIFRELVHEFRRSNTQLVHTHKYKDTILAATAAKLAGVRTVMRTVHGLTEPFVGLNALKMCLYESLERRVHRHCVDVLIPVSETIEGYIKKQKDGGRVVCIRNGIDLRAVPTQEERRLMRAELGIDNGTRLIGAVGRLTPVKGLKYLLRAAKLFLGSDPNCKVLIVGDGNIRKELEEEARVLGISQRVVFLGHREDCQQLMSALDIFVLPSLSEGIPMALLEAMSASRAIVASRVGGVPEVIEDGVHGFLVEPKDVDALATKCVQLVRSPELVRTMGEAARKQVEREFSAEDMAHQVSLLYRELVAAESDE
ncbi:MAG: glycosyltransferase family 4 protein [Nitrospira sp.]|nr:glycosyltransferase family 4 protein [Nitrospira sp.]